MSILCEKITIVSVTQGLPRGGHSKSIPLEKHENSRKVVSFHASHGKMPSASSRLHPHLHCLQTHLQSLARGLADCTVFPQCGKTLQNDPASAHYTSL